MALSAADQARQNLIAAVALARKYNLAQSVMYIQDTTTGEITIWDGTVQLSTPSGTGSLTIDQLGALRVTVSPELQDVNWLAGPTRHASGWGVGGW